MSVRCNTIPTPEDASRPDRSSSTHLGLPKARESSGNNSGIDFEHTNRGVAKTSRGGRASMIFYRIGLKKTNNHVKYNAELFTLTYGAIVRQLLTDLEEVEEVNKQLDQMGYNIGIRLIDEFLANSNVTRCVDFRETAEVIAKVYSSSLESSIV